MQLRGENEDNMCQIVRLEATKLENNPITWNIDWARVLFTELVCDG
jgi:hypothetical protein